MDLPTTFILKIYRGTPGKQYWENFELPYILGRMLLVLLWKLKSILLMFLEKRWTL